MLLSILLTANEHVPIVPAEFLTFAVYVPFVVTVFVLVVLNVVPPSQEYESIVLAPEFWPVIVNVIFWFVQFVLLEVIVHVGFDISTLAV